MTQYEVQHDVDEHDDEDVEFVKPTSSDPFDDALVVKPVPSDTDEAVVALKRLLVTAKLALKVNWIPALVLNAIAFFILILFFSVQNVNDFFTSIAELKDRVGLPFGIVSTSIAAGVIPSIFMAIRNAKSTQQLRQSGQPIPPRVPRLEYEAAFLILFWGYRGLEADLFYRLQAIIVGSSGSAGEVVLKVMIDMFVYNPCWAAQQVLVMYFWKDANFTIKPAYDKFMSREYWVFILPSTLLTTWIVWTPACGIIYCLPAGLQLIMMNIVCCFWSILLQIVTKSDSSIADTVEPEAQIVPSQDEYDIDSRDDDDYDSDDYGDDDDDHDQETYLHSSHHMPHEAVVTRAETLC